MSDRSTPVAWVWRQDRPGGGIRVGDRRRHRDGPGRRPAGPPETVEAFVCSYLRRHELVDSDPLADPSAKQAGAAADRISDTRSFTGPPPAAGGHDAAATAPLRAPTTAPRRG